MVFDNAYKGDGFWPSKKLVQIFKTEHFDVLRRSFKIQQKKEEAEMKKINPFLKVRIKANLAWYKLFISGDKVFVNDIYLAKAISNLVKDIFVDAMESAYRRGIKKVIISDNLTFYWDVAYQLIINLGLSPRSSGKFLRHLFKEIAEYAKEPKNILIGKIKIEEGVLVLEPDFPLIEQLEEKRRKLIQLSDNYYPAGWVRIG